MLMVSSQGLANRPYLYTVRVRSPRSVSNVRGRSKLPAISLVAGRLVTCFEMLLSPIREEGENGGPNGPRGSSPASWRIEAWPTLRLHQRRGRGHRQAPERQ
jgi:hypothetical protein